MGDYVREMTSKKSWKYGKYELLEHLLFLSHKTKQHNNTKFHVPVRYIFSVQFGPGRRSRRAADKVSKHSFNTYDIA